MTVRATWRASRRVVRDALSAARPPERHDIHLAGGAPDRSRPRSRVVWREGVGGTLAAWGEPAHRRNRILPLEAGFRVPGTGYRVTDRPSAEVRLPPCGNLFFSELPLPCDSLGSGRVAGCVSRFSTGLQSDF